MSKSKTSELSQLVELLALIEELGIENLMELLKAAVEGAGEEPKTEAKSKDRGKAKSKAKTTVDDDDADDDDEGDDEGDDDGDDDDEPKAKAKGKGKGKAKGKAKKPECPFKVGDKIELYDEESESWDYASTVEEIDGTTLTVILDDGDDDGDPVEVEVAEDFSDVRLKKAPKKKGKLSRGKK